MLQNSEFNAPNLTSIASNTYQTYKDFRSAALGQFSLKAAQKSLASKSPLPLQKGSILDLRLLGAGSNVSPTTSYILGFEAALGKLQSIANGLDLGAKGSRTLVDAAALGTSIPDLIAAFDSFYAAFNGRPNFAGQIDTTYLPTLKSAIDELAKTHAAHGTVSQGQLQNMVGRQIGQAAGFVTEGALAELLSSPEGESFIKTNFVDEIAKDFLSSHVTTSGPVGIRGGVKNLNPTTAVRRQVFGQNRGQPLSDIHLKNREGKITLNISAKRYNIKLSDGNPQFGVISSTFGKLMAPIWASSPLRSSIPYYFYRAASTSHAKEIAEYLVAKQLDEIYFSAADDQTNVIVVNYYMMNVADYLEHSEIAVHGAAALQTRAKRLFSTPIDGETMGTPGKEMSLMESSQLFVRSQLKWAENRPNF